VVEKSFELATKTANGARPKRAIQMAGQLLVWTWIIQF